MCEDVNECADKALVNGGCDVNATCINNEGAVRTCTCNPGCDGDVLLQLPVCKISLSQLRLYKSTLFELGILAYT